MTLSITYKFFSDLNTFHDYIDQQFLDHQITLMHGNVAAASSSLVHLRALIKQHIHDEEEYLLPLYINLVRPVPKGGAVEFYRREHRTINRSLDDFIIELHGWSGQEAGNLRLVRLFDRYYKFKELLDHHHARERIFLYRLLDRVVHKKAIAETLERISHNQEKVLSHV